MKLSIHSSIRGKPTKHVDKKGKTHLQCNGVHVNLGYGWQDLDADWQTVFNLITVEGVATSAYINSNHRCNENFVSRELVMVDIDAGMRIEDLLNDAFYQFCGAGYYATPSFTEEAHKFRIMFRTETPISDSNRMKLLNSALMHVYQYADISCKDSTRIFFGTVNAKHKEITDRVLTDEMVTELIKLVPEANKLKRSKLGAIKATIEKTMPNTDMTKLLDELKRHYPLLEYEVRLKVAFAVATEMGTGRAITEMRMRWDDSNLNGKYEDMLANFDNGRSPTPGSIYQMIRIFDPNFKITYKYRDSAGFISALREKGLYVA